MGRQRSGPGGRSGAGAARPPAPVVQAKLSGSVHSRERDRAAITHHYDLSNDFYRLILDPTMAYACAYWTPSTQTLDLLESAGLEVRDVHALREHYVRTALAWGSTLESRWSSVVELVGEPMARVWRLYMVGGALTFEENRMGVDQILAVRPGHDGTSGLAFGESGWR